MYVLIVQFRSVTLNCILNAFEIKMFIIAFVNTVNISGNFSVKGIDMSFYQ